ncbi:MAG: nucleotide exchange factor GrpE, partial [Eudoraea sp.]|uniref:nucleotide exchange factor GrpE n=1 Tax=Eudoraea sp. TaxID=1979955 RepID=UPI003C749841
MNTEDQSEEINEMIPEEQAELDLESDDNKHQEEIKSIEEQLQEDLNKEKDKFLRLFAEFENYKKRTSKERMDLFKTAGQEVIVALLP